MTKNAIMEHEDELEFLKHDDINFPQVRDGDYQSSLGSLLDRYRKKLEDLSNDLSNDNDLFPKLGQIEKKVNELNCLINKTVCLYYKGAIKEAYTTFYEGLKKKNILTSFEKMNIISDIEETIEDEDEKGEKDDEDEEEDEDEEKEFFYRMRVKKSKVLKKEFEKREMFHIPLTKRRKIKTQRYSIPGLPCLYLGSSIYICWEELNRPNVDDIYVSCFKFNEEADGKNKILDLSITPHYIYTLLFKYGGAQKCNNEDVLAFLRDYLISWPLIAACSIKIRNKDNNFKPEYIIPQMLIQWIKRNSGDKDEDEFIGLKYFTADINKEYLRDERIKYCQNYAFPIIEYENGDKYCKRLKEIFVFTEPRSFQIYRIREIADMVATYGPSVNRGKEFLEVYEETSFGKYESSIKSDDFKSLEG